MTEAHRLISITPETHDVDIDLVYATDRNLTGKPIYKAAHCLLLTPAEAGLRKAVEIARTVSMKLRIFDAYRPPEAQQVLWDFLPDPAYIADLGRGSNHSRGTAIDLTLVDASGTCFGVLDIDSYAVGAFNEHDATQMHRLLIAFGLTAPASPRITRR